MTQRILTVCRMVQGKKYTPGINLKGEYLKKYGFEVGDMVRVELRENEIVISKNKNTEVLQAMGAENPALLSLVEKLGLEVA